MTEEQALKELRKAIGIQDWKHASRCTDTLRLRYGWTYNRMVETFGERWEEYAQEMDDNDTKE